MTPHHGAGDDHTQKAGGDPAQKARDDLEQSGRQGKTKDKTSQDIPNTEEMKHRKAPEGDKNPTRGVSRLSNRSKRAQSSRSHALREGGLYSEHLAEEARAHARCNLFGTSGKTQTNLQSELKFFRSRRHGHPSEDLEYIKDSGTSFHVMGKSAATPEELKSVGNSSNPC